MTPKITLDQWHALVAVVDGGSYARGAELLHKTQSTVTYAVQKLQSLLGLKVFEVTGRKARLTPSGEVLYRRAKALLDEAGVLEGAAATLAAGWEPELRLAVDVLFPTWLLLRCLARFAQERPLTTVELYETVISGAEEALTLRKVDLAIAPTIPQGFSGDAIIRVRFIAVASPSHPLHRLGRALTLQDLRKHRHLIVRDTGTHRRSGSPISAKQTWTFSNKATSIRAACMGLGFAWYAQDTIRGELDRGELKPLPLREGAERSAELYLIFADRDYAGLGAVRLAQIIREHIQDERGAEPAGAGAETIKRSSRVAKPKRRMQP